LRPEVTGRIAEIRFKEGQRVVMGAVLVKLDDSVTGADAEQARANLWLARSKSERAAELHQKGFVSAQAKDEAEGGLRVAQATLQSAEGAACQDGNPGPVFPESSACGRSASVTTSRMARIW